MAAPVAVAVTAEALGYSPGLIGEYIGSMFGGGAIGAVGLGTAGTAGVAAAVVGGILMVPSSAMKNLVRGKDQQAIAHTVDLLAQSIADPKLRDNHEMKRYLRPFAEQQEAILNLTQQINSNAATNASFLDTPEGIKLNAARANAWGRIAEKVAGMSQEDLLLLQTHLEMGIHHTQAASTAQTAVQSESSEQTTDAQKAPLKMTIPAGGAVPGVTDPATLGSRAPTGPGLTVTVPSAPSPVAGMRMPFVAPALPPAAPSAQPTTVATQPAIVSSDAAMRAPAATTTPTAPAAASHPSTIVSSDAAMGAPAVPVAPAAIAPTTVSRSGKVPGTTAKPEKDNVGAPPGVATPSAETPATTQSTTAAQTQNLPRTATQPPPSPPSPPSGQQTDAQKTGSTDNHNSINFDFDSSQLDAGAIAAIQQKAADLKKSGFHHGDGRHIRVEGDTDAVGTDRYNNTLSQRRAQSVATRLKAELKKQGVDVTDKDIEIVGAGKTHLAVDTQQASRENRRAIIDVTKPT